MSRLFGPMRQLGYLSRDIMQSMQLWHRRTGIGPWYYFNSSMDVTFQGKRSTIDAAIAFANSGGLQIELIQQRNEAPSAFLLSSTDTHDLHYLHHHAFWPVDYDESVRMAERSGLKVIQAVHVPRGRVTYWQGPGPEDPVIELAETTESRQRTRDLVAAAARDWNGEDPLRSLD